MTRPRNLTTPQLFARRFGANPLATILVAVLVLITAAIAALVPRLLERQSTAELDYQLSSIGAVSRSLSGSANFIEEWAAGTTPTLDQIYGDLNHKFSRAPTEFGDPLQKAVGPAQWVAQTSNFAIALLNGKPKQLGLTLSADEGFLSRIRIVSGTKPAEWTGNDARAQSETAPIPVEILMSTSAARSLRVSVGDVLATVDTSGIPQATYRISGLYEPTTPSAQYWAQNPSLVPASLVKPLHGTPYLSSSVFIDPVSVGRLSNTFEDASISLYYPMRAAAADGADAEKLRGEIASVVSTGIRMPGDGSQPMSISTGSVAAIDSAVARDGLLAALLALIASAPVGVTLAVLALGVQAVVRARQVDIALAVARGAASAQVRGTMALEGLVVSVPVAIVATAIAALMVPVRAVPAGFILPALVALVTAILFATLPVTKETAGSGTRLRSQLRGVAELAVILLATIAVLLLNRRGLAQASAAVGIDPLLTATPLLLSVSVGILVLRGYPFLLGSLRTRTVRSRALASFVGAIRATRSPTVGLVGVLALVVGISIAIFGTVMLSTFDGATERSASLKVGADVRVDGTSFSPQQRATLASVPGVRDVAGIQHLDARALHATGVIDAVNVLVGQTDALRSLRPTLARNLGAMVGGRVPVVISSDLVSELKGHGDVTLDDVPIRVAGSFPADAQLGPTRSWVLVDSAFANRFTPVFTPDLLLLRATPSSLPGLRPLVKHALGGKSSVVTVASVTAGLRSEPVVAGVRIAFVLGAAISVLLSAIALVLSTIVAGRARARTAGTLRTLGLPARKLRVLVAWELVPVVTVAVIAGTVLGVILPYLLTAAVDLRPFVGGIARPVPIYDPGIIGLIVGAFCIVVAIVGIVAVAAGERLNPSTALKMGAQ